MITTDSKFRRDFEIEIYELGDILIDFLHQTDWNLRYDLVIRWYANNDCIISELGGKILYAKDNYQ
ncbi:MAG: hypothetical protein ACOYVG_13075 [Bacteroidota bacterium]